MTISKEFRPSYLLQRLLFAPGWDPNFTPTKIVQFKDPVHQGFGMTHPVADQGDIKNLLTFDYMGASEFEWGAIPEGLWQISRAPVVFQVTIPRQSAKVEESVFHWESENYFQSQRHIRLFGIAASADQVENIRTRLLEMAAGKVSSKNGHFFPHILRRERAGAKTYREPLCGWLELSNYWLAVSSRELVNQILMTLTGTPPTAKEWALAENADPNRHLEIPTEPEPEPILIVANPPGKRRGAKKKVAKKKTTSKKK